MTHNHFTRDIKATGVCPECDLYNDRYSRPTEPLPPGQVWVWLGGAAVPHWEVRGTGVVLDPEEAREASARNVERWAETLELLRRFDEGSDETR